MVENNPSIKGKRKARKLALQAFYQWLMSGGEPYELEAQFRATNDMSKVDATYLHRLIFGVMGCSRELEKAFEKYLDRHVDELNPVELSVLRLSTFELLHCPEIPYRIVLDEAVSLAKTFGSQDGHRYVNGVLNKVAHDVRQTEIANEEPK